MASLNYKNEDGSWKKVAGGKTGVLTFKGRAGVVTPKEGDYTAEMVGARPNTWMPSFVEVGGVNPNLLDNWYFGNPVNQRGQMEYVSSNFSGEYIIDRWKLQYSGAKAEVTSSGLKATVGAGENFMIQQGISAEKLSPNTVYTFSILTDIPDVIFKFWWNGTQQLSEIVNGNSFTFRTPNTPCTSALVYIHKGGSVDEVLGTIKAAKLELGSTQTLAHNEGTEEAPNWALNEIPDYGEEMAKCQRYFQRPMSWFGPMVNDTNFILFKVPFVGRMRTAATASNVILDTTQLHVYSSNAIVDGFTFTVYGGNENCVLILASKTSHGLPFGSAFLIANDGGIVVDANP